MSHDAQRFERRVRPGGLLLPEPLDHAGTRPVGFGAIPAPEPQPSILAEQRVIRRGVPGHAGVEEALGELPSISHPSLLLPGQVWTASCRIGATRPGVKTA
jgi:hypothetical protein